MKSIFSPEGILYRITDRFGNLVLLNLLYLICCIPIVTIGPATAALHYVTMKYVTNDEHRVWTPFFHSFKQNFKQGVIVGLFTTGLGIFLGFDLYWMYQIVTNGTPFNKFILVAVALACILYLMGTAYIYSLLARYENSIRQMLKTALFLSIRHLPATVCIAIIAVAPIIMLFAHPVTFMLALTFYFFIGFAAIAYFHDQLIVRIFWQYTPKEPQNEE